jgi:hypothetical protein
VRRPVCCGFRPSGSEPRPQPCGANEAIRACAPCRTSLKLDQCLHEPASAAVTEMVQDGVAEIAHWRGWQMEVRDASGTVLFTIGFEAPLIEAQIAAEASANETYAYNKAA